MAIQTQYLGSAGGDAARFELDYDDATMRGVLLRVTVTGDRSVFAAVVSSTGRRHEGVFGPGVTEVAIPITGPNRVEIVWWNGVAGGRIAGFATETRYPA